MKIADGHALAIRTAVAAARPDPELRVDEWSEEFMTLPKSSPHPGPFRFERTPYARRIAQLLSPGHPCKRVVAKVASQMFKTQIAINWIGACIHRAPANILALQPTDGLAKRFSARVATAIRNVKVLRDCVSAEKSRDKRNTTQAKDFKGDATLYINTAGSAANLAELTIRFLFIDEVDRLPPLIEGDSVELAEARATQNERNCKFYEVSSPTLEGFSKIDDLFAMGTKETYHVPCPHCDHLQELVLANFKYSRDPNTGFMDRAWFICPDCGCEIDERYKTAMLADEAMGGQARWVAHSQGDGETVSVTMSAFYMPVGAITWLSLARQYARARDLLARGDHTAMQVFYNTRLGLSYRNSESTTTAQQLQARAEPYAPRVIPDAGLVVTASVDTQPNRLEVQIEAWGPGMQHWLLDYIVLNGSPSEPPDQPGSVWQRLDEIRRTPFAHASGAKPIPISCYLIDSGGANTQDVYNYGAARRQMGCVIIKGANRPNKPIISSVPTKVDVEWDGNKTEGGAELWMIGTDVAKDYLHNRLALEEGPGAFHFHTMLDASWYEGFLAEKPRTRYIKGRAVREWVKANGDRNEPLDLSVYNVAAAYHLGLHKWSAQDWARLRDKLVPKQLTQDMFGMSAEIAAPVAELPPSVKQTAPSVKQTSPAVAPIVPLLVAALQAKPDHVEDALAMVQPPPPPVHTPAPPPVLAPYVPPQQPATVRRIYSRGIQ